MVFSVIQVLSTEPYERVIKTKKGILSFRQVWNLRSTIEKILPDIEIIMIICIYHNNKNSNKTLST